MSDKLTIYGPNPLADLKSGDVIAVVGDSKRTRDTVVNKFVMVAVAATNLPITFIEDLDHSFGARPLGIAVLSIDGQGAPLAKKVSSVVLRAYEMVAKDTGDTWVFAAVVKAKDKDAALVQVASFGRMEP